MKKTYETAQIDIFLFEKKDVVVASGATLPEYTREEDELPIMPNN